MKQEKFISTLAKNFSKTEIIQEINKENPEIKELHFLLDCGIQDSKELAIEKFKEAQLVENAANAIAYKTKDIENQRKPKELKNLELETLVRKKNYENLENEDHFKNAKNQLIACKYCKSKINKDFLLNNNFCPACKKDMRPETTKIKISRAEKMFRKKEEELKTATEKWKNSLPVQAAWLTRYEYNIKDP